jgi:hypothetical protein
MSQEVLDRSNLTHTQKIRFGQNNNKAVTQ